MKLFSWGRLVPETILCPQNIPIIRWNERLLRRRLAGMREVLTPSETLRVLGIDPAAAGPTGYAVIERSGRTCAALHYGALRVQSARQKSSPGAALYEVHARLCELISEFRPHVMAVESVFTALNMRTALRLAEVRGVVLLAAEQHGLMVHSYSPREVKASVAGYGHADKRQMQVMVRAQLGLKEIPEPADAADALAVALCHLQAQELERRFGVRKTDLPSAREKRVRATMRSANNGHAAAARNLRIQSEQ
jgi:crossover junction endodeoxyribonuclease RuvC